MERGPSTTKWFLTNPNMLVAGNLGTGKSTFAEKLHHPVPSLFPAGSTVPSGRPLQGENRPSKPAPSVAGHAIELGRGMPTRLNPLDQGARPDSWVSADGTAETMTDQLWAGTSAADAKTCSGPSPKPPSSAPCTPSS